jgi:SAM-dependent methyltransferase
MQTVALLHETGAPSAWVQRWSHLVLAGGAVLDVGCGHGRHVRWFAQRNHPVLGIDRDAAVVPSMADLTHAKAGHHRVEIVLADIENAPWPLMDGVAPRQFAAVVVTNYLWRPLLPTLLASLAVGGVLIYETFATGNETVGKPSRADFLLEHGELLRVCANLQVVAFEDGFMDQPARFVQRVVAVRIEADSEKHPVRLHIATG